MITVGCHEGGYFGARKDLCENFSGRGSRSVLYRKPDVVAPGTDIVSCNVNWKGSAFSGYRNAYTKKSGTSMATPVIAGAAALFLQKYPRATNDTAHMIWGIPGTSRAGGCWMWSGSVGNPTDKAVFFVSDCG